MGVTVEILVVIFVNEVGGQTAEETTKAFIGKRQKALVSNKLSNNLQLYTSSALYTCSEANGEMKTWKF